MIFVYSWQLIIVCVRVRVFKQFLFKQYKHSHRMLLRDHARLSLKARDVIDNGL